MDNNDSIGVVDSCRAVAAALQDVSKYGLRIRVEQKGLFKNQKHCFTGGDAVDTMLQHKDRFPITDRQQGVRVLQHLFANEQISTAEKNKMRDASGSIRDDRTTMWYFKNFPLALDTEYLDRNLAAATRKLVSIETGFRAPTDDGSPTDSSVALPSALPLPAGGVPLSPTSGARARKEKEKDKELGVSVRVSPRGAGITSPAKRDPNPTVMFGIGGASTTGGMGSSFSGVGGHGHAPNNGGSGVGVGTAVVMSSGSSIGLSSGGSSVSPMWLPTSSSSTSSSSTSSSTSAVATDSDSLEDDDVHDGISYLMEPSTGLRVVKLVTEERLIEKLTEENTEIVFLKTFLAVYESFMTPPQLLQRILQRYEQCAPRSLVASMSSATQPPATSSRDEPDRRVRIVALRVFSVLKMWIESYWDDFDAAMRCSLSAFLTQGVLLTHQPASAPLRRTFEKKEAAMLQQQPPQQGLALSMSSSHAAPPSSSPSASSPLASGSLLFDHSDMDEARETSFLDVDLAEFARHIAARHHELYCAIRRRELLKLAWTRANKETAASNVLRLIDHTNQLTRWVVAEVCTTLQMRQRAQVLGRFVALAARLRELNDFNGLMEILAALNSAPVRRLKNTWAEVNEELLALLQSLESVMSHQASYKSYRAALKNCVPPCVPYLGPFLSDLTFIEEGNKSTVDNMIHYYKWHLVGRVILQLQQLQQGPGYVTAAAPLQPRMLAYLAHLKQKAMTDGDAYNMALRIEPRNQSEAFEELLVEEDQLRREIQQLQLRNAQLEDQVTGLQVLVKHLRSRKFVPQSDAALPPPQSTSGPSSGGSTPTNTLVSQQPQPANVLWSGRASPRLESPLTQSGPLTDDGPAGQPAAMTAAMTAVIVGARGRSASADVKEGEPVTGPLSPPSSPRRPPFVGPVLPLKSNSGPRFPHAPVPVPISPLRLQPNTAGRSSVQSEDAAATASVLPVSLSPSSSPSPSPLPSTAPRAIHGRPVPTTPLPNVPAVGSVTTSLTSSQSPSSQSALALASLPDTVPQSTSPPPQQPPAPAPAAIAKAWSNPRLPLSAQPRMPSVAVGMHDSLPAPPSSSPPPPPSWLSDLDDNTRRDTSPRPATAKDEVAS